MPSSQLTVSKGLEAIHGKLLNIAIIWTFGNTSSQSGLLIDGTNWIKETLTVEVSMVSRTKLIRRNPEDKDRLLHGLVPPSLKASSDQGYSDPGVATPGK